MSALFGTPATEDRPDLLKNAGLESPFDENCLRGVCAAADQWLDSYDMTGIR